jgi:hypothetical protein
VLRSWDPPAFPITLTVFTPCWLGRLIIIFNRRYGTRYMMMVPIHDGNIILETAKNSTKVE